MKVAVAGIGYVGLSNAVLIAQNHEVVALDLDRGKIDKVKQGISPIHDPEVQEFLINRSLNLKATLDKEEGMEDDYVPVQFHSQITELGVFELWCVQAAMNRRWKLEFSVRDDADV